MDRKKTFAIATAFFLSLGVIYLGYWWQVLQYQEVTDDAYVHGNILSLSPEVSGTIAQALVDDMDHVEKGDLLFTIDSSDYQIAFDREKLNLAWTVRQVVQLKSQLQQAKHQLLVYRAQLDQAAFNYRQRKGLVEKGALSKEDFEEAKTQLEVAQSTLNLAQSQLEQAQITATTLAVNDHPLVKGAIEQVKAAYLNLCRCKVVAPSSGYIAQSNLIAGQRADPQSPVLSVVLLDDVWVEANFKETQLAKIKIGQKATIQSDIYGSYLYQGKVVGIGAGSGSAFSLLPPQNATGNWIKVIQRVPVKIALNRKDLISKPLRIGLSTTVTVDTSRAGSKIAKEDEPLNASTSFQLAPLIEALETEIQKIIAENQEGVP